MGHTMAKYVVDVSVVLYVLAEDLEFSGDHQLLAPTLIRSQVLNQLYQDVQRGELSEDVGRDRLGRFSTMKIRYLGDKVLRRRAWTIAQQLGWDSTDTAEYIALTQLQAEAFVTLDTDLATEVAELVATQPLAAVLGSDT